jgi:Fur family ferric uptake transcriptional regulator
LTIAPRTAALTFGSIEEAESALRAQGRRQTSSRRLVLRALFDAPGPRTAEQLAAVVRLDQASVYRNLETLELHGLVRHMHLGHGPGLYVLIGEGEREYVYCEGCGAVREFAPEQLDRVREEVRHVVGFEARFTHFPIVGLCAKCARGVRA